jgi:cell division transport system permease protein
VPAASLDDHRAFVARMRAMSNAAILGGLSVLLLVLTATVVSVSFATRGAMAANRSVIEVLHFIGAKNNFIAGHFQRRFLILGLQGGAIGGGLALALFVLVELGNRWFPGAAAAEQFGALFGSFSIGILGYGTVVALVLVIALATALTARATVNRTLETIQ